MIKQIVAVSLMNLRNLPQRLGNAWVIVVGVAVTVAVLVSLLAMEAGFTSALKGTARTDRAIVLRAGSEAELSSTLSRSDVQTIVDTPGIKKAPDGSPLASAEAVLIVALPLKKGSADANVTLRGAGREAGGVRPEIHLVAGRMYRSGVRELIVGKSAAAQFARLDVGDRIRLRNSEWTVVGVFESGGDAHESELQSDGDTVLSAYQRTLFQSVSVMLESPAAFDEFKAALTTNPTLKVSVKRESEYYVSQTRNLATLLDTLAFLVGGVMAIGALFGALNTMYSAVSVRSLEIATLRAIGFGAMPIVISIFVEAVVLSVIGSALGMAVAWIFFSGNVASTLGADFSQVVFHLTITAGSMTTAVVMGCLVGLLGAMLPAIRAARLPVAMALRVS